MTILERLAVGVETKSPEQTRHVARCLGGILAPNCTLALHGTLGVGKTTFVGGLADAWGIRGPVTSPTYTYYMIHRGERMLMHLDAYRISQPSQIDNLLIDDLLEPPWALVVEWPECTGAWLPHDALHLDFSIQPGGLHRISLRTA